MAPFGNFFLPGPTEVTDDILTAQARPMIGHRGKGMEELLARIQPRLQRVFRTERPVYISSSSATGLMEGALRNGARQRVLALVNGAFSDRFHKISLACGLETDVLEADWGAVHSPDRLADTLKGGRYDAVTVVHSETSTGALNPIAELAKVTHAAGDVVLLVDSVTGVAGQPVESDAWALDFVLTGSQKAFALPPGLAFGVAQPNILERATAKGARGVYFDFLEFEKFTLKNQTPNTPAVSLLYALDKQAERIDAETITARWARHEAMATRTWAWADEMTARGVPVSVLAPEGHRSWTVTCLTMPPGKKGSEVNAAMKAKGITISAGYGKLKDSTIRIGHMGEHTLAELERVLAALEEVLALMTATYRVLIADKIAADGLAPLRDDPRFELITKPGQSLAELTAALADVDAVIVRSAAKVPREALEQTTRLKVIGRAGVGVDTIDVEAATEKGIAVLNAPAGNTISAAELTLALMLAVVRRISAADRSMKAGAWDRGKLGGGELYGKTLGLVGAGRIGGEVAKRARAFGMRVLIYDPFLQSDRAKSLGADLGTLDDILTQADVLSVHVPLTDSTAGIIGAAELRKLKSTAIVLNVARGEIIDEAALVDALRTGRIAGAGLDVYNEEPLPADHPFRALDNAVLTPHLGASTEEAQQNVALEIAAAVRAALLDGDLSRAVNAPGVGGDRMRRLRPLLDLAERLGRIGATLTAAPLKTVQVRYAGKEEDGLGPICAAALIGVLSEVLGHDAVNVVNAMHLATGRGIAVERTRLSPRNDYAEYLEVRLTGDGEIIRVGGAVLEGAHPRVVRIGEYHVDIYPRGNLILLRNRDVPGVIGRVGSALAAAVVNIGQYHVARLEAGGEALAAIGVDGRLSATVMEQLRALPEVTAVRQVSLD